jgi:hypothetical protein
VSTSIRYGLSGKGKLSGVFTQSDRLGVERPHSQIKSNPCNGCRTTSHDTVRHENHCLCKQTLGHMWARALHACSIVIFLSTNSIHFKNYYPYYITLYIHFHFFQHKHGWRFQKRPAVDMFLSQVSISII